MASSQVEMASSPFGCVLRDRNRRDRSRERETSNARAQAAFQKNLKELVRDHLHTCIVLSTPRENNNAGGSDGASDENSQTHIANRDCGLQFSIDNRNDCDFRFTGSSREEESSAMRRRQTQILDRWADRQAKEMITTLDRQTHEAELLALSNSHRVSTRASTFLRENSQVQSDGSLDIPNLGASSLVQRWREFEAEATSPTGNQSAALNSSNLAANGSSRTNSGLTEIGSSLGSEVCDSVDERFDVLAVHEGTFGDWESDRTAQSETLSTSQRQVSDVGESERVRVVDIIRRLTSGSRSQSSLTSWSNESDREHPVVIETSFEDCSASSDQREQWGFPRRLRVRGRQAIMNLLMKMELERQRELNRLVERRAVSRFSQRGRIQSLLRLRFLQREVASQDHQRRPVSTATELNQLQQGTTILFLRERFNRIVEGNDRAVPNGGDNSRSHTRDVLDNAQDSEPSVSSQLTSENINHHQEVARIEQESVTLPVYHHSVPSTSENLQEVGQSYNDTEQSTGSEVSNNDLQGTVNTRGIISTMHHDWERNLVTEEESDANNHQVLESTNGTWLRHISRPRGDWESRRQAWYRDIFGSESSNDTEHGRSLEVSDINLQGTTVNTRASSTTTHDWEENSVIEESDSDNHQVLESTDWIRDISRPRIYWESRRQEWYRDVLENNLDNDEIRQLLERGRVSTSLASGGFRERMDRLIGSVLQRQRNQADSLDGEEEEEEEDEEEEEEEEEGEEEDPTEHQFHDIIDASDHYASTSLQLPLPPQLRSWSPFHGHEVHDDQLASTSFQPPQLPSQPYYQDNRQQHASFMNHHSSLEMELIYDLRDHMTQLHQEMSDLRKSIESCMDMQLKLKHSIKQEVSAAECHSVHEDGKELLNQVPLRKGNCCICYEMRVDSLLYRCGHMCTCFKCAHELQWSTGKCPICRAPIVDVVRAYTDS